MITADQLLAHAVGDYVIQSDWMANEKTKKSIACLVHVITYTMCFLPLTQSPAALAVILLSHFVIDRWRLARYICWFKNFLQIPKKMKYVHTNSNGIQADLGDYWEWNNDWENCKGTGYHESKPPWMSVWLMIIADNTVHVAINGLAIAYL